MLKEIRGSLIEPKKVWEMENSRQVFVSKLTLLNRKVSLVGYGSNPTKEDKLLADEIEQILKSSTEDEKYLSITCKQIRKLLVKENTSLISFATVL